jgi:hypothetical protein
VKPLCEIIKDGILFTELAKLVDVFQGLDANRDQVITIDEYKDNRVTTGSCTNDNQVNQAYTTMDANKDGKVSYDEFKAFNTAQTSTSSKQAINTSQYNYTRNQMILSTFLGIMCGSLTLFIGMLIYKRRNPDSKLMGLVEPLATSDFHIGPSKPSVSKLAKRFDNA